MKDNTEKGNLKPSIIKLETCVFIINAEYMSHLVLVCLLLRLSR